MDDDVGYEEAVALLDVHEGRVHTTRQAGFALLGADWSLDELLVYMKGSSRLVRTGPLAAAMGHGLAAVTDGDRLGPLFIATRKEG